MYIYYILIQVADRVQELGVLAGKSTISLVAAALYLVVCLSETPKPAAEIAKVAGCTEATLKNGMKLIQINNHENLLLFFVCLCVCV